MAASLEKTRYVWRLERGNVGAFTSNLMYEAARGAHSHLHNVDPASPPRPTDTLEHGTALFNMFSQDDNYDLRKRYHFGFRSLEQYKRWCRSKYLRKDLKAYGGILKRYKVSTAHIVDGNWQCAFDMRHATWDASRYPDYAREKGR